MKKVVTILVTLFIISPLFANAAKRPLIELGPKGTLYINGGVDFGLGVEVVVNPLEKVGFRSISLRSFLIPRHSILIAMVQLMRSYIFHYRTCNCMHL